MARKGGQSLPPASDSDSDSDYSFSSSDDEADVLTQPPQKPHQPPSKPHLSNKRKNPEPESSVKKAKTDKSDPSGSTLAPDQSSMRLWSHDDEILLLKGLVEFKAMNGKDPTSKANAVDFFDFIKGSVNIPDLKKDQVVNKVRRLKRRFHNAKNRTLTNPHELHAFELSKSLWDGTDDENENGTRVKKSKSKGTKNVVGKKVNNGDENVGSVDGVGVAEELIKFGNVDESVIVEGIELLSDKDRDALEDELFNLNVVEMEQLVRRLGFQQRAAKAVLNALKSTARH